MTYLATDLDGTFIPLADDQKSHAALAVFSQACDSGDLQLVYVTGRHLESVREAIRVHALPIPKWIVCDVGSSVYCLGGGGTYEHVSSYHERLSEIVGTSDGDKLRVKLAEHVPGLRLQEPFKQGPYKLSYYVDASVLDACVGRVETYLAEHELPFGVVSSVDPFNGDGLIDVMPRDVSKAFALEWWCKHAGVAAGEVVFAGDSGNDYAALAAGHRAILVGNADRLLAARVQAAHEREGWRGRLFLASEPSTAGVLEGAYWFGLIRNEELAHVEPSEVPITELHHCLGATAISESSARFSVWAPKLKQLEIEDAATGRTKRLERHASGYHTGVMEGMSAGSRYWVKLPKGIKRADPTSRYQPEGVHGPSQVVSRQFAWTDGAWRGIPRDELIIYELHIGTFTEAGTFASAIERLDELVELGVTAIELMPLNEVAGRWNWGYDGVNLFAIKNEYGTPDDFRRLVDAAHAKGLGVLVDVVYNHFGPEGNYLGDFRSYISKKHSTPWGSAPNLDGGPESHELRRILIANALEWFDAYHVDALRVDALHCIRDDSRPHWVTQLAESVQAWARTQSRRPLLIAEANVYDPELLLSLDDNGHGFDAAWCDCFLHSIFAAVRPGEQLTNRIYESRDLVQVLEHGFIYEGTITRERQRRELTSRVHTHGLVYSIQNHDFIGNHPLGKRLHQLTSPETQRAAAALLLLSPAIPMLFMGEEFCCESPFAFFVDFGDERLRRAVVKGRRAEYPQHDWSGSISPIEPGAFEMSRIGPRSAGDETTWRWYRSLISLRKQWRRQGWLDDQHARVHANPDRGLFVIEYTSVTTHAAVAVQLSPQETVANATGSTVEVEIAKRRFNGKGARILHDSRPSKAGDFELVKNHAKIFVWE